MNRTKQSIHWKNAALPEDAAFFAIGDIHAHNDLLVTLLAAIEKKISAFSADIRIHIIFIGDYVDRGPDASGTIDTLLDFERRLAKQPNVSISFLCGNHDEILRRLFDAEGFVDEIAENENGWGYLATLDNGFMRLRALEAWLSTGGGVSTLCSYYPAIDLAQLGFTGKYFERNSPEFSIAAINESMKTFAANMPPAHKDFFRRIYNNHCVILGDYLFTHAGINPHQTLEEQGITEGINDLEGKAYIDFLMIRDPFLWRDDLPNCPYVVIHGHTPSAIEKHSHIIADGQKNYRLCIDTGVYMDNGALTCFMRHDDQARFLAVNKGVPHRVLEYDVA